MKNIIKISLILFFFANSIIVHSQSDIFGNEKLIPNSKYAKKKRVIYENTRNFLKDNPWILSCGYSSSNFINPQYGKLIQDKTLQHKFGYSFLYRNEALYPLLIDASVFSSGFGVDSDYNRFKLNLDPRIAETKMQHQGTEFSLSLSLLPFENDIFKYVYVYAGIGYSYSHIVLKIKTYPDEGEKLEENASWDKQTYSESNISSLISKIGMTINFGEIVFLDLQYKQSLNVYGDKSFNQFLITAGFRIPQ